MKKQFCAKKIAALLLSLILWISSVEFAMAATYSAYIKADSAALYTDMALKNKAMTLSKWRVLTVLNVDDDLAAVRYDGKLYYVKNNALASVKDTASAATINANTTIYEKANTSSKSAKLAKGTKVNLIATSGVWALIEKDGNSGFCKKQYVTVTSAAGSTSSNGTATASIKVTVVSKVKVYKEAKTSSKKLGELGVGVEVNLLQVDGSWAYIELEGNKGYCTAASLKPSSSVNLADLGIPTGVDTTITASSLTVYQKASKSSSKIGTLKKGAVVKLISVTGSWAYISSYGNYGYVDASGVKGASGQVSSTPYEVTASSCKVYLSTSTSSKVLGTLQKGATVNRVSTTGSWSYIELNGTYGYVKSSSLQAVSDKLKGYTIETVSATVIYGAAKRYDTASESAKSEAVAAGTAVTVTAYNDTWAYCKVGTKIGYIKRAYLNWSAVTTLAAGSTGTAVKTMESALLAKGYFDGVPGTTWTDLTANAVKLFRAQCGMSSTGGADAAMQRVLYGGYAPNSPILSATFSNGSTGANVTRIQARLYALKYLGKTSSVDGDYGSNTAKAVTMFQQANGLSQTGKVDAKTVKALYSASAIALPSGQKAADGATSSDSGSSSSDDKISGGDQKANSPTISSSLASTTKTFSSSMTNKQKLEYVIYVGQCQLGKKYVFGATGTATFDCSGFTQYSFKQAGVKLLRTAYQQGYNNDYTKISSVSSLKRGDLVFFNTVSDSDSCDHVGIYLGAGWFIHASSGQAKVVVSNLTSGYYNRVFSWGRRILP